MRRIDAAKGIATPVVRTTPIGCRTRRVRPARTVDRVMVMNNNPLSGTEQFDYEHIAHQANARIDVTERIAVALWNHDEEASAEWDSTEGGCPGTVATDWADAEPAQREHYLRAARIVLKEVAHG